MKWIFEKIVTGFAFGIGAGVAIIISIFISELIKGLDREVRTSYVETSDPEFLVATITEQHVKNGSLAFKIRMTNNAEKVITDFDVGVEFFLNEKIVNQCEYNHYKDIPVNESINVTVICSDIDPELIELLEYRPEVYSASYHESV